MTELLDFCKENWMLLTAILFSLISFLAHLFQKRPLANSYLDWLNLIISYCLPDYIVEAEKTGCIGCEKKKYVLDKAVSALKRIVKLDEHAEHIAIERFSDAIEEILETPRKKGN